MALGFKIADGYVEVHADYDKAELRRAAQGAADGFDDSFQRQARRSDSAAAIADGIDNDVNRRRHLFRPVGVSIARGIRDGLVGRGGAGFAAAGFMRSFVEAITFGQADFGRIKTTGFARVFSGLGLAAGALLATNLILTLAEGIVASAPLVLAALSAIPIIFLAKTDKQVKSALKAWKKDAADFMEFVSRPIKIPFLKSLQEIRDGFTRLRVPVRDFFAAVGAGLPALARGGMDFLLNFFKALKPVLPNITLGMKLWGVELGKLGKALGDAFQIFLKDPDLLRKSIQGFSSFLQSLIKVFANLVVGLAYVSAAIGNFIRLIQLGFANSILPQWLSGVTQAWGPLRDAIVRAWEAFKKFATAEGDEQIVTRFKTLIQRIKDIWEPLKPFLREVFKLAWDGVKLLWETYVVPWWENTVKPWLKEKIKGAFKAAVDALLVWWNTEGKTLLKQQLKEGAEWAWQALKDAIKQKMEEAKTEAKNKAKELVTGVVDWIKSLPGKAAAALSSLASSIGNKIKDAATAAKNKAKELVDGVVTKLKELPGKAASAISTLWSKSQAKYTELRDKAKAKAKELVDGFITKVKELPGKAATEAGKVKDKIVAKFNAAKDWLKSAGADIINGLAAGIRSAVSGAVTAAANAAKAALDAAKRAIGVSSPSKAFAEEVGVPAAQGIAVGLRKQFPEEMKGLRKSLPQLRLPETEMAGAMAGGAGGGFSPTINLYMQPGFYSENAAAKRALTKDVYLALEAYRKDYER